jgi:hypothetical protein
MAANVIYTQPVNDYFSAIPMRYKQEILETLKLGITDGLSKEELRPQLYFPGIPKIPDLVYDEIYDAMIKAMK